MTLVQRVFFRSFESSVKFHSNRLNYFFKFVKILL